MRAIGVEEFGGPEQLKVVEIPLPEPKAGQVRIRVHAVTVNPTDTIFRAGGQVHRIVRKEPPFIPGMDAAGVIDALGPDTDGRFAVGDRVVAIVQPTGPYGGAYCDYIVISSDSVVHAPKGLSFPEASSFLMNALTARLTLEALNLKAGDTIAVTGAAGFYGSLVAQLALADGLRVIADAAPKDEALVRSFGVTDIVPRGDDVAQAIRELAPEGVDGLADGSVQTTLVLPAIKDGGGIALVRGWDGEPDRGITAHPILVSLHAKETAKMSALVGQVEDGTLHIRVAEIFKPEEAAKAHQLLEAGGLRGRVVIDLS